MKIKQVEELVGITRKNIRFYEEQGLLNVSSFRKKEKPADLPRTASERTGAS